MSKMTLKEGHREAATVSYTRFLESDPDHGCVLAEIGFDFGGSGQALQCVLLNAKELHDFERCVERLFRAKSSDLVGKACHVLRAFSAHSAPIVGIECDGERFTVVAFARRRKPEVMDHLAQITARRADERARLEAQLARWDEETARYTADFVDWEKP